MSSIPFPKQFIIDALIFMSVCLTVVLIQTLGKPTASGFWCNDQSLSYPYKQDTVSVPWLMVFCFGGPLFVMLVTEILRTAFKARIFRRCRTQMLSLGKAYGVFLFGMAATLLFTEATKFWFGKLRPHFFEICRPDFERINCSTNLGENRFVTEYKCTNTQADQKLIEDSKQSFPSGHASMAMFSALFTILYLQMRMEVKFTHFLKPTLQMSLLLLALFCCLTRVTDRKHFPSDVIAGAVLGACLAWLAFYRLGRDIIPTQSLEKPTGLPRATSIESEPQTPTPLLRPERLVISHSYRNVPGPGSKGDFVNKV